MKSRIIYVLFLFLLSTLITSCSGSKNNLTPNTGSSVSDDNTSDTSIPASSSSPSSDGNQNSVLEAFKAVLLDNAEFFSTDNKRKLSLDDFLTNKEIYGTIFKVTHLTAVDMDEDQVPEVVLELTADSDPEFYEVLHYINGTVYGYNIVYRGLEGLKTDGTFHYSSGAADHGYGKLKFQSNAFETDIMGYMESSQNSDGIVISYVIHDKPVTKEAYDSFMEEQDEKDDVVWYEFSQRNVETALSAEP